MNALGYPRPVLLLVSAPSGAGKTTLCHQLLAAESARLRYSVSCTTRPPRKGETDGADYFFLSREQFETEIAAGAFLEYAEVYGNYYGTRISFLRETLAQGISVLMDVDVQGADIIRKALLAPGGDAVIRRAFVDVFIHPPSLDALRARLEGRGKDDPHVIERRMRNAEIEIGMADEYRFQFVNEDLPAAFETFKAIYHAAGHLTVGAGALSPP